MILFSRNKNDTPAKNTACKYHPDMIKYECCDNEMVLCYEVY